MKKKTEKSETLSAEDKKFPLPIYSADEDIFSKDKEVSLNEDEEAEKNARLAEGLDVPGSELDDADEEIGEEDEENNYYSLGGDDHNDLEEDKEEDR
jgi:hypothetical protein